MMSASAKETALAAVKTAEEILGGIEARLKPCQQLVNQAKSGNGFASLSAYEQLQQRMLLDQCDAMVALDTARKNLARFSEEEGSGSNTATSSPRADLANEQGPKPISANAKRQRTLAGFVFVKCGEGELRELFGPKSMAENIDLSCGAPGCSSGPFKSIQGLVEHQRGCEFYRTKVVSQQSIREILRVKRSRIESVVAHQVSNVNSADAVVDLSREGNVDEVHTGPATESQKDGKDMDGESEKGRGC